MACSSPALPASSFCMEHEGWHTHLPVPPAPPHVDYEEWLSLVLLEAPSIYGVAAPGTEVLERSEPTFPSPETSESESVAEYDDTLAGYSPSSPCRSSSEDFGFNIQPPAQLDLSASEPAHPGERMALSALRNGWTTGEEILRLTEHLPSSLRDFQAHAGENGSRSCLFTTGAFVYGNTAGAMLRATGFRYVSALLAAILRSVAPGAWFSSATIVLNVRSGVHRDLSNFPSIENILVPLTCFGGGELWLADSPGDHVLEGMSGRLLRISRPCVQFSPRTHHATMQWEGTRLVVVGFHIRSPELLAAADMQYLQGLGFAVYAGR